MRCFKMNIVLGFLICLAYSTGCWSKMVSGQNNAADIFEETITEVTKLLQSGKNDVSPNKSEAVERIVGGRPAALEDYPWIVSIYGHYFCCGSIVNPSTILTAANCVIDTSPDDITIRAGDRDTRKRDYNEQRSAVTKIILHPKFNEYTNRDIAILKLKTPLVYNKFIQPIDLATPWKDAKVTKLNKCVTVGYGTIINPGYRRPWHLQEVESRIAPRSLCKNIVDGFFGDKFTQNQLCSLDYETGGCDGDEGGPYICYDAHDRPHQVGILSWGTRNCRIGFNVYTRVSKFGSWIKKNS